MSYKSKINILFLSMLLAASNVGAQDDLKELDLIDDNDLNLLLENENINTDLDLSKLEEIDDLEALKNDAASDLPDIKLSKENQKKLEELKNESKDDFAVDDKPVLKIDKNKKQVTDSSTADGEGKKAPRIFEVGSEEKNLLELAKYVEKKIPNNEWNEIATAANVQKYVVQEGDWLWKISQALFGSGFYYSKIWSMNPQITNPHEIEPGQVLIFDTGTSDDFPKVELGTYSDRPEFEKMKDNVKKVAASDFDKYGEGVTPPWLAERKKLVDDGAYFQYISNTKYEDVLSMNEATLKKEFSNYQPPESDLLVVEPGDEYDASGFSETSKFVFKVSEGFYLNTFVTTNHVQDLGKISAKEDESVFINKGEVIFVEFDKSVKVRPGDMFSIYDPEGSMTHPVSDRAGYKYSIMGQVKAIRQNEDKWECQVTDISGIVQRGSRLTVYTPKISKIFTTFNKRSVEAAVIGTYKPQASEGISMGDVVYLDRGRVDGVELGNVFELYDFVDKGTGKRITNNPTYTTGEAVVITLTDNFATALITNSSSIIKVGSVGLTKSEEKALREQRLKQGVKGKELAKMEKLGLEELDVELHLDDLSQDLLEKIDDIQINEDELEELERQEREKSVIKEHEKDLKELERLEKELINAENKINEPKLDEDAYLEAQNLENLEKKAKKVDPNAFESMDEIESKEGKKYMDEDLNSKENPYGLTEFDLEEIDELLNTDSK